MSHQIVLQPNGKFAIWSSGTDEIISQNATAEELIEYYGNKAKHEEEQNVIEIIKMLREGGKPYFQFTKTWEDLAKEKDANNI